MRYSDFAVGNLVRRLAELSMKNSTPKRLAGVLFEAMEVIQQLQKQTAPPPDAPLSLEELRGMDGEPVWNDTMKKWVLVDLTWEYGERIVDADGKWRGLNERYYRRRPEEGTV